MKVQCSCGAKSVFEINEEMRTHPVRFSCPACGVDASEFVDSLIRQALEQTTTPGGRVVQIHAELENPIVSTPGSAPAPKPQVRMSTSPATHAPPPTPPANVPRVRLQVSHPSATAPASIET